MTSPHLQMEKESSSFSSEVQIHFPFTLGMSINFLYVRSKHSGVKPNIAKTNVCVREPRRSVWCMCVFCCGVGNKLRDSCKETRFYFLTQLRFVFCCFCLTFGLKNQINTKHKPQHTHTHFLIPVKFPFKGRVGRDSSVF